MLAHHHEKLNAAKRGNGSEPVSLEELPGDGPFNDDGSPPASAAFDRKWAAALVENTLAAVADEFSTRGRADAFTVLRNFLPSGGDSITLEEAARRMDTSVGAVKAAVHRLRERFRELLRAAVAATVAAPHEVDEELLYLRSLMLMPPSRIPEDETRKLP
jgi:RNA polymerase sigma-70 factor (ECF subfamily)